MSNANVVPFEVDRLKAKLIYGKTNTTFFTTLMYGIDIVVDNNQESAYITGDVIGLNEHFMSKHDDEEQQAILVHLICHKAFHHTTRKGAREEAEWNRACDYWVTDYMKTAGFILPDFMERDSRFTQEMLIDDIYQILIDERPPQDQDDNDDDSDDDEESENQDGNGGGNGDGDSDSEDDSDEDGDSDEDSDDDSEGEGKNSPNGGSNMSNDLQGDEARSPQEKAAAEDKVNDQVLQAAIAAEAADEAGSLPSGLQRMIDEYLNPTVPWATVLSNYLAAKSTDDYSWSKPNRRFEDIYMPTAYSEGMGRISIYIDCSVSVTQEEFLQELGEAQSIKDMFDPEEMDIIFFNQGIESITTFRKNEPLEINLPCSGGTNIFPVMKHIRDNPADVAVIFTDGYFHIDQDKPEGTPIFWGIVDNEKFTYPFGEVLPIKINTK